MPITSNRSIWFCCVGKKVLAWLTEILIHPFPDQQSILCPSVTYWDICFQAARGKPTHSQTVGNALRRNFLPAGGCSHPASTGGACVKFSAPWNVFRGFF
jgi:hypothetical protein